MRRNKIERVQATLLVMLVAAGAVLALSGFGHEIVDYLWFDPRSRQWFGDYIAKAGGWLALRTAIAGSIYTAIKASPTGGDDIRAADKQTATSRLIFAVTPTLVVVVLAVILAWTAHWLLGLPIGYTLCFVIGWGVYGLWVGLSLGLIVVGVILLWVWTRKIRDYRAGAMLRPVVPLAAP